MLFKIFNPILFERAESTKQSILFIFFFLTLFTQVSYLKANEFGGAFVWSLDLDDFDGRFCEQGDYPFTSHLHNHLKSGNQNA